MKLLYAYRYGIVGGVSTQLLLRKRALEQAGFQCELFFTQDNGLRQVLPAGIEGVHFGNLSAFRQLAAKGRFDAVVVIDTPELLSLAAGPLWRRNRVFLDVHTTTQTGLSYLDGLSIKYLAGIMVPSAYSARLVERRRPDWRARIHVIANLLNTEVFTPAEPVTPVRSGPQFIWVGKLDKHKNWRLALIYARLLKDLLGDMHLYVVGGYTAPEATAEAFFELAYRLDISDVITWLDRVENVQLARLYHRCAHSGGAMLVTSRDESFGMAAAEALLCGCPLITNDLPVFREVFPESSMVQRVDIWQPGQVASAVERLSRGVATKDECLNLYETLRTRYGVSAFVAALRGVMGSGA
ncbi:glycosyltransferase [Halomonas campisalis]|uniref:Glycosyltransferase n=1 Tax=Billgrantia campisalis TaxID=74661 RepID=A0ABS9P8E0_9GAMM|nr:glycosyltransferase [Halomonas campisalis]MCG6658045.1 glycosyltransferase [Halomonas campisalis]MDR5862711.1 glycosyltransferase [Halomonas campisalis]